MFSADLFLVQQVMLLCHNAPSVGESVESLIVRVATDAIADAGIAPSDVDEIVLGHFNAGFSQQDFTASLVLQASPDLRFKRATRVENACATGSAAVHQGLRASRA